MDCHVLIDSVTKKVLYDPDLDKVLVECIPTGACCVGSVCTIETESDCNDIEGTYQGNDTTCDPNPCPEISCVGGTPAYVCATFSDIVFDCGCVDLASTSITVTGGDVNGCYFTEWSGTLWSGAGVNDQGYDYDEYTGSGCGGEASPNTRNFNCYIWCDESLNWNILLANPSTHHAAFKGIISDLNTPVDNILGTLGWECGTAFTVGGAVGLPSGNLYVIAEGGSVALRQCDCQPDSTLSISAGLDWVRTVDCDVGTLSWTSHFSGSGAVSQIALCYFRLTGDADVTYTCCPGFGTSGTGTAHYTIDVFQDGSDWKLSVLVEKDFFENWCGLTGDFSQSQNIDLMSCTPVGSYGISTGTNPTLTGTVTVAL